jgi:hypothetical protein
MDDAVAAVARNFLGIYEIDGDPYDYPKSNNLGNIKAALEAAYRAGQASLQPNEEEIPTELGCT